MQLQIKPYLVDAITHADRARLQRDATALPRCVKVLEPGGFTAPLTRYQSAHTALCSLSERQNELNTDTSSYSWPGSLCKGILGDEVSWSKASRYYVFLNIAY